MSLFCKHKYKIIDKIKVYDKEVRFYYDSNQKKNDCVRGYSKNPNISPICTPM